MISIIRAYRLPNNTIVNLCLDKNGRVLLCDSRDVTKQLILSDIMEIVPSYFKSNLERYVAKFGNNFIIQATGNNENYKPRVIVIDSDFKWDTYIYCCNFQQIANGSHKFAMLTINDGSDSPYMFIISEALTVLNEFVTKPRKGGLPDNCVTLANERIHINFEVKDVFGTILPNICEFEGDFQYDYNNHVLIGDHPDAKEKQISTDVDGLTYIRKYGNYYLETLKVQEEQPAQKICSITIEPGYKIIGYDNSKDIKYILKYKNTSMVIQLNGAKVLCHHYPGKYLVVRSHNDDYTINIATGNVIFMDARLFGNEVPRRIMAPLQYHHL